MLDKAHGAVTCAHCHTLGADTQCKFCQRMVHRACLAAEGCPVPHPVEIRLGLGKRLRDIDETGRYATVGPMFGGFADVEHLSSRKAFEYMHAKHEGQLVAFFGPWKLGREIGVRAAATYFTREIGDGQTERVYVDPLLYVVKLTPHGLGEHRFQPRPRQPIGHRMNISRDGRWAVWSGDSRLDVIDLERRIKPRALDLRGKMLFDVAVSGSMDLVALAQWGQLYFFGLSDGWRLGQMRKEDDDFTCVLLAAGKVVHITAGNRFAVHRAQRKLMPAKWERLGYGKLSAKGSLTARDACLSPDGRLLAVRRKRKQVAVIDLEQGGEQILGGHTDTVSLVRFINNGRRLVTADDDNRVIIWPREEGRIISGE